MFYKPNFCCSCGEKIERAKWTLFTSRRFCGVCETEHKGIDYLPRAAVALAALITVLGAASYLRSGHPAGDSSGAAKGRARFAAGVVDSTKTAALQQPQPANEKVASVTPASQAPTAVTNSLQRQTPQKTSTEAVYFCGALTKKGTACTRRVKTKGRCWQHQGQPTAAQLR
jgi:hypothetical protein